MYLQFWIFQFLFDFPSWLMSMNFSRKLWCDFIFRVYGVKLFDWHSELLFNTRARIIWVMNFLLALNISLLNWQMLSTRVLIMLMMIVNTTRALAIKSKQKAQNLINVLCHFAIVAFSLMQKYPIKPFFDAKAHNATTSTSIFQTPHHKAPLKIQFQFSTSVNCNLQFCQVILVQTRKGLSMYCINRLIKMSSAILVVQAVGAFCCFPVHFRCSMLFGQLTRVLMFPFFSRPFKMETFAAQEKYKSN